MEYEPGPMSKRDLRAIARDGRFVSLLLLDRSMPRMASTCPNRCTACCPNSCSSSSASRMTSARQCWMALGCSTRSPKSCKCTPSKRTPLKASPACRSCYYWAQCDWREERYCRTGDVWYTKIGQVSNDVHPSCASSVGCWTHQHSSV